MRWTSTFRAAVEPCARFFSEPQCTVAAQSHLLFICTFFIKSIPNIKPHQMPSKRRPKSPGKGMGGAAGGGLRESEGGLRGG